MIQQNAANAEESAAASEEMNAQALTKKGMVDKLLAIVGNSAKAKKSRLPQDGGTLWQKSAKLHEAIASAISNLKSKAGSAKKSAKPVAEAVLPLDDDEQVSDFKIAMNETNPGAGRNFCPRKFSKKFHCCYGKIRFEIVADTR